MAANVASLSMHGKCSMCELAKEGDEVEIGNTRGDEADTFLAKLKKEACLSITVP